jgi:biopolymer transport protein ExbD
MLNRMADETGSEADDTINISPLIDIVFLLLLFFIVTSVFVREAGVEVKKPEARAAEMLDRNSIYIAVTAEGRVHHGGAEIGLHGIGPTLRRIEARPSQPVIIQADGRVPTQLLISVLDEVKLAGMQLVNVATLKK